MSEQAPIYRGSDILSQLGGEMKDLMATVLKPDQQYTKAEVEQLFKQTATRAGGDPITENYHTHTFRCKHAKGDVKDYAEVALDKGIVRLGISDHTPLPDNDSPMIRMGMDELPDYIKAIEDARKAYPNLQIYKGMECDYFPRYHSFFKDVLLDERQFDYLIGSVHAVELGDKVEFISGGFTQVDDNILKAYVKQMLEAMESGLFLFMAHPDLFAMGLRRWTPNVRASCREILSAAESLHIPLEINTSGYEKSRQQPEQFLPTGCPMEQFWEEAAGYHIEVVVNSDAHDPALVNGDLGAGYKIMKKYNLKKATLSFAR